MSVDEWWCPCVTTTVVLPQSLQLVQIALVNEWWCHLRDVHDPFLAIYNNCAGQRDKLLVSDESSLNSELQVSIMLQVTRW